MMSPVTKPTAERLYRDFEALLELDLDHGGKRQRIMLSIGRAIEMYGSIPPSAETVFRTLLMAWESETAPDTAALMDSKVEIWQILDAKNSGNSATINDAVDRSLRALLCLAEPAGLPSDLWDSAGWAAEMLSSDPWPRATRFS